MTMECVTPKQSGGKSCGAITVAAEPVEAIVSEAVLRRVDGGALRALLRDRDDPTLLAELAKVERQLIENRRDYTDELITRPVWQDEHGRLTGRQKALTARLEAGRRRAGLEGLSEPLRDSWPSLPLARRRAVVRALVEAVTIAPATSRRFEPERVSVRWRA